MALVEECTFDQTELTYKVNLFDLHHKYADVMSLPKGKPLSVATRNEVVSSAG